MQHPHRHRAVVRAEPPGPPKTPDERNLERIQTRLTTAQQLVERLTAERDRLALSLWLTRNVPQSDIAERLDRAARRAGGEGISYAATQKRLWRAREALPIRTVA